MSKAPDHETLSQQVETVLYSVQMREALARVSQLISEGRQELRRINAERAAELAELRRLTLELIAIDPQGFSRAVLSQQERLGRDNIGALTLLLALDMDESTAGGWALTAMGYTLAAMSEDARKEHAGANPETLAALPSPGQPGAPET